MSEEDDRAALRKLLDLAREQIVNSYRRGVELGYNPPVVGLKVSGDFSQDGEKTATVKVLDPDVFMQLSPTARNFPGEAFGLMADILDVPDGHFRVMVSDETGELLSMVVWRIPDDR